jgi:hypothetical protein
MNKAAVRECGVSFRLAAVTVVACAAAQGAWAQAVEVAAADLALTAGATAALRGDQPPQPRLEVTKMTLPRLEGLDSATSGPRLDMTLLPPRKSFGLAVGMSGFQPAPAALGPNNAPATNFDVGMHWRHGGEGNYQVDVTAWRRMTQQVDAYTMIQQRQEPTYMARVELNLSGKQSSGLVADRGFLGLQLESGARITLRRKNGGAMLYYRAKF